MNDIRINPKDDIIIKEFDFTTMTKNHPSILIIGKQQHCKEYICEKLFNQYSNINNKIVIDPTTNKFYKKFVDKPFIYKNYSSDLINNIINRQKNLHNKFRLNHKIKYITKLQTILLIENINMSYLKNDMPFLNLYHNSRCYSINLWLMMDNLIGIERPIYDNYLFLFAENDLILREILLEKIKQMRDDFYDIFDSDSHFYEIFDVLTSNDGCMIIDNNKWNIKNMSDIIYHCQNPKSNKDMFDFFNKN